MKLSTTSRKTWTACPQCDFPIDVLWNGRYCRRCGCDNTAKYLRFPSMVGRMVVRVLRKAGLRVEWDVDVQHRIEVS